MKSLIITEFKRNFKSLLMWTGIVAGSAAMMLMMFSAFNDSFGDIEQMLNAYPEEFLKMFGFGEGQLQISNIYGWYGIEGYLFVTLIGGSYAAILGASILSKEEDDKTIEFLLSKPISRNKILVGKATVILLNLLFLNTVLAIVTLFFFSILGDFIFVTWLLYAIGPFILQVTFASIAFMISIFVIKSRKVMSISIGIVIGMYAIDLISKLTDSFTFLKYFTPYEYVNAVSITIDQQIKGIYLFFVVMILLITNTISWYFYNKKDIVT